MSDYKIDYCHHDSVTAESRQEYIKREDALTAIAGLLNVIEQVDGADVVEVVRCKDCKWYNLNKWAEVDGVQIIVGHEICDFWGGGCKTQKNGYCSYGERKDE